MKKKRKKVEWTEVRKREIKYLIGHYYRIQKHRVAMGNQVFALNQQKNSDTPINYFHKRIFDIEKEMKKYLKNSLNGVPIWEEWLSKVKGIGEVLGCALIAFIDIKKAKHPSNIWSYFGLAPNQKRKRGEKVNYNPLAKTIAWKIADCFIKSKSPYRKIYDERKKYEQEKHPELTKGHINMRARRYMVKRFLVDLYVKWRELEGLPVSKPYVVDVLKHQMEDMIVK